MSIEDKLRNLWTRHPQAPEIYQDENGIFWLGKDTATRQSKKTKKIKIYKRVKLKPE